MSVHTDIPPFKDKFSFYPAKVSPFVSAWNETWRSRHLHGFSLLFSELKSLNRALALLPHQSCYWIVTESCHSTLFICKNRVKKKSWCSSGSLAAFHNHFCDQIISAQVSMKIYGGRQMNLKVKLCARRCSYPPGWLRWGGASHIS